MVLEEVMAGSLAISRNLPTALSSSGMVESGREGSQGLRFVRGQEWPRGKKMHRQGQMCMFVGEIMR